MIEAMTRGQGRCTITLLHCEAVPPGVQAERVGKHKVQDEEQGPAHIIRKCIV